MLLWDYEKEGYYTYKLTANDGCCEECSKLSGKEFLIKDFKENEFFPVVHPNCKCEIHILDENGNAVTTIAENIPQEEKVSLLDQISNFLAVASLIPGFDTFTDLVSIPIDLLRGDFLSAGLDAIGVIPVFGEIADTAKIINKADDIADIAKLANKADDAIDAVKAVDKVDDFLKFPKKIHEGRQGKHIVGHNNYRKGKSIFEGTMDDAEELIKKYSGTGQRINSNSERVDFKRIIGKYVNEMTGQEYDTTVGTIRYSMDGTHIVPARPIDWRE